MSTKRIAERRCTAWRDVRGSGSTRYGPGSKVGPADYGASVGVSSNNTRIPSNSYKIN
jgi:hypothetical protein